MEQSKDFDTLSLTQEANF